METPSGDARDRTKKAKGRRLGPLAFLLGATAAGLASLSLTSCGAPGGLLGHMAVATAPEKPAREAPTDLAIAAKATFWEVFSAGRYDEIDQALEPLTAAYLEYPYDPELALLIAHSHLWRVGERARWEHASGDPAITDDLIVAAYYFDQARRLAPDDARIDGWLASCELALGTIHNQQEYLRRGWFRLKAAWRSYPEFNGFTFGHNLSATSPQNPRFETALRAMWDSARRCSEGGGGVSPDAPAIEALLEVPGDIDPACWNTAKAPYNFQGFWWALGVMEAKAGSAERARACFDNARLAPNTASWPYLDEFEDDARQLPALIKGFAADEAWAEQRVLFNTPYSCMACHQAGAR